MILDYIKDNNIKVAIFDMDGTLTESNQMWSDAIVTVLKRHKVDYTHDEWKELMMVTTLEAATHLHEIGRLEISPKQFTEETNIEARRMYREEVSLKPGASELVRLVRGEGLKMYIASSTERSEIAMMMDKFELSDCFDGYYPMVELGTSKRDPQAFTTILDAAGANANETILFEDALYSMKTGASMGMHIVAIQDDFEKGNEDAIADVVDIYVKTPQQLL